MAEQMHAVDIRRVIRLFQEALQDLARNAVDAAYRRQDPQLVADPHLPAGTAVNLHLTVRSLRRQRGESRLIMIVVEIVEIGARIVRVDNLPGGDRLGSMADRQAVLHHPFAPGQRLQRKFMPAPHRLFQHQRLLTLADALPFLQVAQRHGNIVEAVDLNDALHVSALVQLRQRGAHPERVDVV
ncbi:Uncharacterised protein [Klebsiella pneumoniae]|nr:Uncharacterised protein [Klebsiella pneumoniae]